MTAGYSGTPLVTKLGLKPGMTVWFRQMPDGVRAEINPEAIGLAETTAPTAGLHVAHIFETRREDLEREVGVLRDLLAPTGFIWVSWPKKSSRVPTDITEDVIRDVVLPTGLVDVKVCAIDQIWSGLKLMIRKELR